MHLRNYQKQKILIKHCSIHANNDTSYYCQLSATLTLAPHWVQSWSGTTVCVRRELAGSVSVEPGQRRFADADLLAQLLNCPQNVARCCLLKKHGSNMSGLLVLDSIIYTCWLHSGQTTFIPSHAAATTTSKVANSSYVLIIRPGFRVLHSFP